jgi:predicted Rossmann fold nucleotide-binding protein DprA/Smf involved in DNA uptake
VCTGADDVLGLLGLCRAGQPGPPPAPPLSPAARAVLDALDRGPATTDAVMAAGGLSLAEVAAVLAELEGAGRVSRQGGWIERRGDR